MKNHIDNKKPWEMSPRDRVKSHKAYRRADRSAVACVIGIFSFVPISIFSFAFLQTPFASLLCLAVPIIAVMSVSAGAARIAKLDHKMKRIVSKAEKLSESRRERCAAVEFNAQAKVQREQPIAKAIRLRITYKAAPDQL